MSKLREKYLGWFYEQRLLDQWYILRQNNKTVSEYIDQFNEFIRRCNIVESEAVIISRFWAGLYRDIQWKLFQWQIPNLEEAYHITRKLESYQRELMISQSKSNKSNPPEPKPRPSWLPLDQPIPIAPS